MTKTLLNTYTKQFNQLIKDIQNFNIQTYGDYYTFTKHVAYTIENLWYALNENSDFINNYENDDYYKAHMKECETWYNLSEIVNNVNHDLTSNELNRYMDAMDYLLIVEPFDLID